MNPTLITIGLILALGATGENAIYAEAIGVLLMFLGSKSELIEVKK